MKELKSPLKIFAGDVGIKNVVNGFRDKEVMFENIIFFKIKKNNFLKFNPGLKQKIV